MSQDQCTSPVYIFTYVNKINDIFIYIDKIRQSFYPSNVFCKNKWLNESKNCKIMKAKL